MKYLLLAILAGLLAGCAEKHPMSINGRIVEMTYVPGYSDRTTIDVFTEKGVLKIYGSPYWNHLAIGDIVAVDCDDDMDGWFRKCYIRGKVKIFQ
jgi:hypothetical protein